uniref:Uncharacterized protein n=1 Tax=Anopheles farauti TaxID=69004 RepID=A0A182Q605_9DIPT
MLVQLSVAAGMSMTVSVRVSTLMMSIDFRVMSMSDTLYMSLETVVLVRRVLDYSFGSIGLMQGVSSLDDISIPMFPLAFVVSEYEHHDYHSHPSYKFEYGVKDPHTGDHKSQWEHRDGDVVKGAYTLHEADGTERIVEYSSDKHNGFQAHSDF